MVQLRSDGKWYLGWGKWTVQQRLLALALHIISIHLVPLESLPEGGCWKQEVLTMRGLKASGIDHPKIRPEEFRTCQP